MLFGLIVLGSGMFALKITDNIPFSYQFVKDEEKWKNTLMKIKNATVYLIVLLSLFEFMLLGLVQNTELLLQ